MIRVLSAEATKYPDLRNFRSSDIAELSVDFFLGFNANLSPD